MNQRHGTPSETARSLLHVRSLPEACLLADEYQGVLTVGPYPWEVSFIEHPNHRVFSFEDVEYTRHPDAPTRDVVEAAIRWGAAVQGDLLVHCHMGISRSTATALGILIARGEDPEGALRRLKQEHPREPDGSPRPFAPNRLMVVHIGELFGIPDLLELRDEIVER
jgi:hypothetical protein